MQTILKNPIFVLKRELLKIPLFGLYLKKIDSIAIDRNKINRDNLNFMDDIKEKTISSNRPLIIFPQGTRTNPEEKVPFRKGVSRIYQQLKIRCLPIVINSGDVWSKKGVMNCNKTIFVSILKPIENKMEPHEFLKILENNIYSELDNIR